ncbi:MAG: alpha/beta hydrolase [Thiotrichales bacterium]|nr:alpha/beta hydrolase [Thiotrichales bacterium]MCY4350593.1 alpha/beta hydrolase [Thiotrichales bacterium]
MPTLTTDDGVRLAFEETGSGTPVVFVHEFAGDLRSWEPQVRHLSRRYRCITWNARGFPPSDVPDDTGAYSQNRARDDVRAVLDALDIERAHVVGLSMGGFATLHFGLAYPERARSLVVAGVGYGAEPDQRERFRREADLTAQVLRTEGMAASAKAYSLGPTRVQFQNKDPRGWGEFAHMLAEHSAIGSAHTQQGVQKERPSVFDLADEMRKLTVPTLIVTGDEDWPCLVPSVFMKRTIPSAGLLVVPNTGHTINLEEPAAFNAALADFFAQIDAGRWPMRDPRAESESITGMK